jgi:hypothetical protein
MNGKHVEDMTKKTIIIPGEAVLLPDEKKGPFTRRMLKRMKKEWTLMIPSMSAPQRHCVAAGVDAWRDFAWKRQTWEDWVKISNALEVGEQVCKDAAGKGEGGKYNRLYSAWLTQQGLHEIASPVRSWLKTLREDRVGVEQFRSELDPDRRMRLNHPRRVLDGYREWQTRAFTVTPAQAKKRAGEET